MNEKSQTGTLFVKAASTDSCPECTWFVRMYGDASTDMSKVSVTTTSMQGPTPKQILEIRPMGMSSADPGEGQLFMPVRSEFARPEGTWFLRVNVPKSSAGTKFGAALVADPVDELASKTSASVSKVQEPDGAVTFDISLE